MRRFFLATGVFATLSATLMILSCGGGSSATQAMNSVPSGPSGGGSTPTGATVINNIEDQSWLTCGACGDAGGTGPIAQYSATPGIASPSEDGSSARFSIAATVPFTNAYFYQPHPSVDTQFAMLTYEFDLFIPPGSEDAPQAIEFECQQKLDGWIYNFSWQADFVANTWRIFNYGAKQWEESGLSFQHFTPGTWHHVMAEYHSDSSSHSVFHDALTVDNVRTPINLRHDAFFAGGGNQFTNAVQLDSNRVPAAYSLFVDQMQITYK